MYIAAVKVVSAAGEYGCGSKFNSARGGAGTWLSILESLSGLWQGFALGHLVVFKLFLGSVWELAEIWGGWIWPAHLRRSESVNECHSEPVCLSAENGPKTIYFINIDGA